MISAGWYNTANKDARNVLAFGRMIKTLGGVSMSKSISGIYAIVNKVNGNRYIGSSWNIKYRWDKHLYLLRKGKHHSKHLQHAWLVYGESAFDFIVLEECDIFNLISMEQKYIDAQSPVYNVCVTAGSRLGVGHTEKTKEKLRQANLGKKYSDETKRKQSLVRKGVPMPKTPEWIAKIVSSRSWYKHSDDTKEKISKAATGRKQTEEDKHKKSLAAMGNQRTLGLIHTDETKRKMSIAKKKWWADRKAKDND